MDVHKETKKGITVFYLTGELDLYKAQDAKDILIKEFEENNIEKAIINMEAVPYVDSSGVNMLLAIASKSQAKGMIRICSLTKQVYEVLKLSGFLKMFDIDNKEEDSVKILLL
ncbi:STAS domain-containing protein [Spirochaetota bacterium]